MTCCNTKLSKIAKCYVVMLAVWFVAFVASVFASYLWPQDATQAVANIVTMYGAIFMVFASIAVLVLSKNSCLKQSNNG